MQKCIFWLISNSGFYLDQQINSYYPAWILYRQHFRWALLLLRLTWIYFINRIYGCSQMSAIHFQPHSFGICEWMNLKGENRLSSSLLYEILKFRPKVWTFFSYCKPVVIFISFRKILYRIWGKRNYGNANKLDIHLAWTFRHWNQTVYFCSI